MCPSFNENISQPHSKSRSFIILLISVLLIISCLTIGVIHAVLKIRTGVLFFLPILLLLSGPISLVGCIWGIAEQTAKPVYRWIGIVGNGLIALSLGIFILLAILANAADLYRLL